MTQTETFERHSKTGLPVQQTPTFEVGDLVSEHILSDCHPGVVVHATAKTVYVAGVDYAVGNVSEDDVPGYNGYGDSATLVVDPESVKRALAKGKDGAAKYVLHVGSKPSSSLSGNEREQYGSNQIHRASWQRPGGSFYLTKGASYRRDPHV
jgi:hypothetical protein